MCLLFLWQQIDEESEEEESSSSTSLEDDEVVYTSRSRPGHVVICDEVDGDFVS